MSANPRRIGTPGSTLSTNTWRTGTPLSIGSVGLCGRRDEGFVDLALCNWSIETIASRSSLLGRSLSSTATSSLSLGRSRCGTPPTGVERDLSGRDLVKDLGSWPNPKRQACCVKRRQPLASLSLSELPPVAWAPLRELQVKREVERQRREARLRGDHYVATQKPNAERLQSKHCLQSAWVMDASSFPRERSVSPKDRHHPYPNPAQPKVKERPKPWDKVYFWNKATKSSNLSASPTVEMLTSIEATPTLKNTSAIEATPTMEVGPGKSSGEPEGSTHTETHDVHNNELKRRQSVSSVLSILDDEADTTGSHPNSRRTSEILRHPIENARRNSRPPSAHSRRPSHSPSACPSTHPRRDSRHYPRSSRLSSKCSSRSHRPRSSDASVESHFEEEGLLSVQDSFLRHNQNSFVTTGQNLCDTLAGMGYVFVFHDILEATTLELTLGRMALDFEDFSLVADTYIKQHIEILRAAFNDKANPPGSDIVAPEDLPGILAEVGIQLMCGFEEDLPSDSVSFERFMTYYHDVSRRAGLTLAEYRRIMMRMQRLLSGRSRKMIALGKAFELLNFHDLLVQLAGGKSAIEAIIARVGHRAEEGVLTLDVGMDTTIPIESDPFVRRARGSSDLSNLPEFMIKPRDQIDWNTPFRIHVFFIIARIIHENISQGLLSITRSFGFDFDRSPIRQEDLVPILEECGFIQAVFRGVTPFIEECGFKEKPMLRFGEVYTVVLRFALANGLTESDLDDIADAFCEIDKNSDGVLAVGELNGVIRWLGYQPTLHRVYNFAEEFGVTETSSYTCKEFQELVSQFYRMNMWSPCTRFYGLKRDCSQEGSRLPIQELGKLLNSVGYDAMKDEVSRLIEMAGGPSKQITFAEFKELELKHRQYVRSVRARNGGLTEYEVAKYTKHFRMFADHEGFIGHKQMREILIELFPARVADKEWNIRLVEKLKKIDPQSTGKFDLRKYMALRHSIADDLDKDVLMEGLRLRQELGYTREEIKQFRDLYAACDSDMSGSLDFSEVLQIFSLLVDLSSESSKWELKKHFEQMDDGDNELTFFEFLQLVHRLQVQNWRNINLVARQHRK